MSKFRAGVFHRLGVYRGGRDGLGKEMDTLMVKIACHFLLDVCRWRRMRRVSAMAKGLS